MKILILLFTTTILFSSCNTNPDYSKNLIFSNKKVKLKAN